MYNYHNKRHLFNSFVTFCLLWTTAACSSPTNQTIDKNRPEFEVTKPQQVRETQTQTSAETAITAQPIPPNASQNGAPPKITPTGNALNPAAKPAGSTIEYYSQSGDTLKAVAAHFEVKPEEITSPQPIPPEKFFPPEQVLTIPNHIKQATTSANILLPDSEVIFAISAADFDIKNFATDANGVLNTYGELRGTGWYSGAEIVNQTALDYSINPRLLLSLLEYQSHWVYGKPEDSLEAKYPLGIQDPERGGLFSQFGLTAQDIMIGYYGWRDGSITELVFPDGTHKRLAPTLNAGTVGLMYFFSQRYNTQLWEKALYGPDNIITLHERMFGDRWERARAIEPLIPGNLDQPVFELPFQVGRSWNFTSGPHAAWGDLGTRAALDFSPVGVKSCASSPDWATAVAPGLIVRVGEGPVIQDLDGDGYEQTGWNLLYMHIASQDRVEVGTFVKTDAIIGHPSCYGNHSTETHVHFARKYNGEWMLTEGPTPLVLGGWQAINGVENYTGKLVKGNNTIQSSQSGIAESQITR